MGATGNPIPMNEKMNSGIS